MNKENFPPDFESGLSAIGLIETDTLVKHFFYHSEKKLDANETKLLGVVYSPDTTSDNLESSVESFDNGMKQFKMKLNGSYLMAFVTRREVQKAFRLGVEYHHIPTERIYLVSATDEEPDEENGFDGRRAYTMELIEELI